MPIYIKYGDIKGDVTATGHLGSEGWVEINSFQFGIGRGIAIPHSRPASVGQLLFMALAGIGTLVAIERLKTLWVRRLQQ